jgi:hypothetical protein
MPVLWFGYMRPSTHRKFEVFVTLELRPETAHVRVVGIWVLP